jgi:hypothetical protein
VTLNNAFVERNRIESMATNSIGFLASYARVGQSGSISPHFPPRPTLRLVSASTRSNPSHKTPINVYTRHSLVSGRWFKEVDSRQSQRVLIGQERANSSSLALYA